MDYVLDERMVGKTVVSLIQVKPTFESQGQRTHALKAFTLRKSIHCSGVWTHFFPRHKSPAVIWWMVRQVYENRERQLVSSGVYLALRFQTSKDRYSQIKWIISTGREIKLAGR